jgi:hypothetical protein
MVFGKINKTLPQLIDQTQSEEIKSFCMSLLLGRVVICYGTCCTLPYRAVLLYPNIYTSLSSRAI